MNHSETIIKTFTSKTEMTNFVNFLDMDEILIRRDGDSWHVIYNATKTTITVAEENNSEANVMS